LAAELRRRGIDHLHVHLGNAGAEVAMHAARYGAPRLRWSLTLHGSAEFDDVHRLHLEAKLGSAQRVACVSDWVRAQAMMRLAPEHWDRLEVVRLGIDTQAWTPPQQRRSADGRLRILTIGRLEAVKAQALLVEAVARLRADGVDAELTLAGEGPERARLEAAAARAGLGD